MHPDLVKLLELQSRDQALLEADQRLDAVLAQLEALDAEAAEAARAAEAAHRAVADAQRRRQDLETKIENYKKLEERGKARLDQVRSPRELAAVTTELDLARSVLQKEEADWIRLADTIAGLEVQARDADQRLEQLKETQAVTRQALSEQLAAAEAARNAARAERERAAQEVERVLRTRYERLRAARRTKVVVALAGAACGACYTTVPLNRRSQIQAGVLIDSCESCGVILYSDDASE
ncbi:MAG TPA: hypothetical protein VNJ71_11845 [Gemmatimonadales bacterium]|jgi:predicted  nucleic acid-binding Zn-ribbon protein|nr:hypothetical protein [Gemmatimonadales bacterium]